MKKINLVSFLILAGISIYAQESGVIKDLNGTVELKASSSSSFVSAKTGDLVMEDTVISTGFKSSAFIEVGSALLTVRPLTRLTLAEIRSSAGHETINMNLQAGRVRVDVNPPAGTRASVSVSSPSATASVRGTSFEFDTRNLIVHQGTVSFRGIAGQRISINSGSSTGTGENGQAINPIAGSSGSGHQSPGGGESSPGSIVGAHGGYGGGGGSDGGGSPDTPTPPSGGAATGGGGGTPNNDPDVPGIIITW